ncbi:MAG: RNA polymerase sigma factor RpoE [Legionellales bacterium]|nr:RNA polymerase sigma factor RpoE [Legionellales bacterium]HBH10999.1 RNA polymerase sigma factor RpoE [Gammaproteobacteria bacterium]
MADNATDKEIIERVKSGEKEAYDLLVLKYQQRVINLISRFVKNHSDALDVSQETFIKAYRALPNFRGDSAFYTWLYRIAVNTAKNHLTVQSRKITKSDYDVAEIEQIEGNMSLTEQTTPESLLAKDELQETILKTIENLPEDLKSAIMLREIEGLSYEGIAEVMECPVGTVRSRIFRAREMIDSKIKPLLEN